MMTTRNPENDLCVMISPTAVKAVNQHVTVYEECYTNATEGFTSFLEWFNTVWDIEHPDCFVNVVKIS